jgi:glutamate dehydrogenase/leucine dehydrogenase
MNNTCFDYQRFHSIFAIQTVIHKMSEKKTIALAGVGNCGMYFCEELSLDNRYDVVVLTRQVNMSPLESFQRNIPDQR